MHEDIIQLSTKKPISESDYITADCLPEWFLYGIADYCGTPRDTDHIGGSREGYVAKYCPFKVEGDHLVIDRDRVEEEMAKKYERLRADAEALLSLTYEDYCKGRGEPTISHLEQTLEDKFGIYVFDEDDCILYTFDRWLKFHLRNNPDAKVYVGEILDYHF